MVPALLDLLKGEGGLHLVHFAFHYFMFEEQPRVLALVNLVEVTDRAYCKNTGLQREVTDAQSQH